MESFKASFLNEIEKMYRKKKAVLVVIMSLIIIVIVQLMVTGMRSGFGLLASTSSVFPITVLSVFANTILPLFTALVVTDTFTGEFSQNTMKIAITKPITRVKLYSSKIAATGFFVLANLLIVMVLSMIAGFLFNSITVTFSAILRIMISYLMTLFPIMTLALVIAFFANFFRSGAIVFFLSIVLFAISKALGFVFSTYSNLFITSMLDWYKLWIADTIPIGKVLREFLMMAGYMLTFFTAGYYLFDRKDL